ncbi:hypothetical protein [Streptomyces mexicanus]|uniref:Uncharacterized protein n=1 Tax=Streptomyces mexicanus TaxID=178566 RepID=A0A7X1LUI3_9ACTN|nr:hypothetical protein [Streptomyces mexicanus]MBC2869812.1 hypothetical protein [Streptomyces mexicanus]
MFGPGARITFRSAAPAGSVVTQVIGGSRVRVLLDDYVVLDDRGRRYFAAELHCYL